MQMSHNVYWNSTSESKRRKCWKLQNLFWLNWLRDFGLRALIEIVVIFVIKNCTKKSTKVCDADQSIFQRPIFGTRAYYDFCVCVSSVFSIFGKKIYHFDLLWVFTQFRYIIHGISNGMQRKSMRRKQTKKNETSEKPGFKSNEISNKAEINQMEQRKPSVMNQRFELVEDVDNLEYQTNCILHSYLLFSVQTCWKSVISQISLCKVLHLCMCLCMYVLSYKGFIEFPTNMFIWMCVHQPKMANGKWCDGRRWANE